jgi:hypothetical protein
MRRERGGKRILKTWLFPPHAVRAEQGSQFGVKSIEMKALFRIWSEIDLEFLLLPIIPTWGSAISNVLNNNPRQPPVPRGFLLERVHYFFL